MHPDLDRSAIRIQRRTDNRDFGIDRLTLSRNRDGCFVTYFKQRGFRLWNMGLGDDLRNVHNCDNGGACGGHLSGIKWTICDHAINWTSNLGVTHLCCCSQEFPLGGFQLSSSGFQRLLFAGGHQCVQMLLCNLVLISGLRQIDAGLIEFFARDGALLKEFLPAVIDFLLRFQHLFGRLCIQLCLLDFLRQLG